MQPAADLMAQAFDVIRRGEGVVCHLYLDTCGLVTVGIGNQVIGPESVTSLALIHTAQQRPATDDEKRAEYKAIKAKPFGKAYGAQFYAQYCKLQMALDACEALWQARMNAEFLPALRRGVREFDSLPVAAQLSLMDMVYNLGVGGLFGPGKYPHFRAAVDLRNWELAAENCHRGGIQQWRNDECAARFRSLVQGGN